MRNVYLKTPQFWLRKFTSYYNCKVIWLTSLYKKLNNFVETELCCRLEFEATAFWKYPCHVIAFYSRKISPGMTNYYWKLLSSVISRKKEKAMKKKIQCSPNYCVVHADSFTPRWKVFSYFKMSVTWFNEVISCIKRVQRQTIKFNNAISVSEHLLKCLSVFPKCRKFVCFFDCFHNIQKCIETIYP